MALSEQSRSTIYEFLVPNIGEEAAREMLSNFPTDDESPPASEELVRNEFAAVRAALAGHDGRITSLEERMDGLDGRMDGLDARMDGLDTRMDGLDTRMDGLDTRMDGLDRRVAELDRRMTQGFADARVDLHEVFARQTRFMMTTLIAMLAVLLSANALFR